MLWVRRPCAAPCSWPPAAPRNRPAPLTAARSGSPTPRPTCPSRAATAAGPGRLQRRRPPRPRPRRPRHDGPGRRRGHRHRLRHGSGADSSRGTAVAERARQRRARPRANSPRPSTSEATCDLDKDGFTDLVVSTDPPVRRPWPATRPAADPLRLPDRPDGKAVKLTVPRAARAGNDWPDQPVCGDFDGDERRRPGPARERRPDSPSCAARSRRKGAPRAAGKPAPRARQRPPRPGRRRRPRRLRRPGRPRGRRHRESALVLGGPTGPHPHRTVSSGRGSTWPSAGSARARRWTRR